MSGNQDNFDIVTQAAGRARLLGGTRAWDGDYRARILAAAVEANGGRRNDMVDRIVDYQCDVVGRTEFLTPKGKRVGGGCHKLVRGRFYSRRSSRDETAYVVKKLVESRPEGTPVPTVSQLKADLMGDWRQGPAADALKDSLIDGWGAWNAGVASIRTALRALPEGQPPIITRNRRNLSRPAQDLIHAFEEVFPKSAVHYTSAEECQRKLYIPSENASTQRSQKRRLDAVLSEIETAKNIGISVRRMGGVVYVGRGRAIPENLYYWVKKCAGGGKFRWLTEGLATGRAGLFSTPEGELARELVATIDERFYPEFTETLARAIDPEMMSSSEILILEERADGQFTSARKGVVGAVQMRLAAEHKVQVVENARANERRVMERLQMTYASEGLSGLWSAARQWPGVSKAPTAVKRMDRIARILTRIACPDSYIQAQRFELEMWRTMPRQLRSPEPPRVNEYSPEPPRVEPVKKKRKAAPVVPSPPPAEMSDEEFQDLMNSFERMRFYSTKLENDPFTFATRT